MKECPKCKTMLEDDAVYCVECGEKQEVEEVVTQVEETPNSEEKYCIHCGKLIEAESVYCPYCGKSQEVEEVKSEEPQPKKPKAKKSKSKKPEKEEGQTEESAKEESPKEEPKVEEPKAEEPKAEEAQPEEEAMYEEEEEKKSKKWLWILILFLIVGGGIWYLFGNNHDEPQPDSDANKENAEEMKLMEENREKEEMLAFVKEFYLHYKEEDFIYENVNEGVINHLRRDYPYYCEEYDCLATWVFSAYPAGTEMNLEVGPIIVQVANGSVFDVSFKYSYMDNEIKKYEERTIRLYVHKEKGQYKIFNYRYDDKTQATRYDEDKRIKEIPWGKYHLTVADMHILLSVHDSIVEGEYYFHAGSSLSTSIKLYGKADNGLKLHLSQTSVSGKDLGFMDGTFDGKTFKGEFDKDGYRCNFEAYVGGY